MAEISSFITNPQGAFMDFLEDNPNVAYQGFSPQFGKGQGQQRFFQNTFQNVQNQWLGDISRGIMQGGDALNKATQSRFTDHLGGFDFGAHAASFSPWARGEQNSRYNAPARWLTSF